MLQQVRQLIAVGRVDGQFQGVRGFCCFLRSPTFRVGTCALGRIGGNLVLDGLGGFADSLLHIRDCHIRILLQSLHDGIGHSVNRNSLSHSHHLRTLLAVSFSVSCRNWKSSTRVML
nr:MAG TPA: hypothetical protein [Caudoviricetes sp.]